MIAEDAFTHDKGHEIRGLRSVQGSEEMLLDLLKFGLVFFLPTIIGRTLGLFRHFKRDNFSIAYWRRQRAVSKLGGLLVVLYITYKLLSMFVLGTENFYATVRVRSDSPSYMIRNQYRNYVSQWMEKDARVATIVEMKERSADMSDYPDKTLLRRFEGLEFMAEQLKTKEKKGFYSKFGEEAFLRCEYCTTERDYAMFLVPSVLFDYAIFLIMAGMLTAAKTKSKWRAHGLLVATLVLTFEMFSVFMQDNLSFELYDLVLGKDYYTLSAEKRVFIRNASFVCFLVIACLFDYGLDLRLQKSVDDIRKALDASLALLQSARLQKAAVATDETLQKFIGEQQKGRSTNLAQITNSASFRQKVAEAGSKLDLEELTRQHGAALDALMEMSSK